MWLERGQPHRQARDVAVRTAHRVDRGLMGGTTTAPVQWPTRSCKVVLDELTRNFASPLFKFPPTTFPIYPLDDSVHPTSRRLSRRNTTNTTTTIAAILVTTHK